MGRVTALKIASVIERETITGVRYSLRRFSFFSSATITSVFKIVPAMDWHVDPKPPKIDSALL